MLSCLQLPTLDALTRSGDSRGHIQRGTSRILRARVYLDLLAFCTPSPPDYMRAISGTGRGDFALFFASHESGFKVPSDCYMMAAHRLLGPTPERVSHARKCPRRNEAPPEYHALGARLPLPCSLALGAHHGKIDADLRTSALLGTPSVESVHDYYFPFAL
jgi:hypothetical protein